MITLSVSIVLEYLCQVCGCVWSVYYYICSCVECVMIHDGSVRVTTVCCTVCWKCRGERADVVVIFLNL